MSSSKSATKPRAVLTPQLAREIFRLRHIKCGPKSHSVSTALASEYQVSSKAIRDIWCGRCWLEATSDLWGDIDRPQAKTKGRPKGSKDRKPRQVKSRREMPYGEKEYAFTEPGSAQPAKTPSRISSGVHSQRLDNHSIHIFNQTHQMPCTRAIVLEGLKSMVPASNITPTQHMSSFAQLPCIVDTLNNLAFSAPESRISDRANQRRGTVHSLDQQVSSFQYADVCMQMGILPLPATTSSTSAIYSSMPGLFPHVDGGWASRLRAERTCRQFGYP
jgi:hypothetical protein